MEITTAGLDGTALAAAPVPAGAQRERAKVRRRGLDEVRAAAATCNDGP